MSSDRTTEILNYLSAMSRDIGEFRAETKSRLDALEARMENLETEMRAGFEQVHSDIRRPSKKVDIMNQDLLDLRVSQHDLESRMEALERKQA